MPNESVEEFCARQSSHDHDMVRADNWLLFANGAAYEDAPWDGGGTRQEPPTDPFTLAHRIRQYWKFKLARAESEFRELFKQLEMHINVGLKDGEIGAPPQSQMDRLTELRQRVDFMRSEYQKAKDKYDSLDPRRQIEESKKRDRVSRQEALEQAKNKLRDLNI